MKKKDKTILITGGAGFLARSIIESLSSIFNEKFNLILIDINLFELRNIKKKYLIYFGYIDYYKCDLSNPKSLQILLKKIVKKYKINALINNAAYKTKDIKSFYEPYETYSYKTYKQVMTVNLDAAYLITQFIGSSMIENKIKGSIINISSIYGSVAPDQNIYKGSEYKGLKISSPAVYTISKSALHGLSIYLASYWGKKNIRINTVSPGGIYDNQNKTFERNYSKKVPMGRMAKRDDIVGAIVFLLSDSSKYITGQNIIVDGGLSII